MRGTTQLLLSAIVASLALPAACAPAEQQASAPAPTTAPDLELLRRFHGLRPRDSLDEWVSVINEGQAVTYTPSVTIIDGKTSTVNPAPTITGPAPTAVGTSGAGNFLVCNNKEGVQAPFCTPKNGSTVVVGRTYYLTWDTTYFAHDDTIISVHGDFIDSSNSSAVFQGFVSDIDLLAGRGFYAWTPESSMLGVSGSGNTFSQRHVNLWIAIEASDGSVVQQVDGPDVFIVAVDPDAPKSSGPNLAVVIAVSVVCGMLALAIGICCVWCCIRRRRKHRLGEQQRQQADGGRRSSWRKGGGGSGYGIRKSQAQRVGGGKGGVSIMLSPTSPTAPRQGAQDFPAPMPQQPTGGSNVFREEVRRQERETNRY